MRRAALAFLLSAFFASSAAAQIVPPQNSKPVPDRQDRHIPAARDMPYPGTMQLTIDASDVTRAIFRIHQTIPVAQAGDFVLLYPKWVPGGHSPPQRHQECDGLPLHRRAGASSSGSATRSTSMPSTSSVPQGVAAIDVDFQYVSPTAENQGRIMMTPDMASIQPIATSLYPAGYYVRQIPVQASVIVPAGWKIATALRPTRPERQPHRLSGDEL